MMPIIYAKPNEELELVRIASGKDLVRRLSEMGIYPGTHLKVISNSGTGPIIVEVNGKRFGLGIGIALKILVTPAK